MIRSNLGEDELTWTGVHVGNEMYQDQSEKRTGLQPTEHFLPLVDLMATRSFPHFKKCKCVRALSSSWKENLVKTGIIKPSKFQRGSLDWLWVWKRPWVEIMPFHQRFLLVCNVFTTGQHVSSAFCHSLLSAVWWVCQRKSRAVMYSNIVPNNRLYTEDPPLILRLISTLHWIIFCRILTIWTKYHSATKMVKLSKKV